MKKKPRYRIFAIIGEYTDEGCYGYFVARSNGDALRQYIRMMNADVEGEEYATPVFEKETRKLSRPALEAWIDGYSAGFEAGAEHVMAREVFVPKVFNEKAEEAIRAETAKRNRALRRPLGKTQRRVLESLVEHKGWAEGCGWVWTTDFATKRYMDQLVERGLAQRWKGSDPRRQKNDTREHYDATEAGRKEAKRGSS